MTYLLLQDKNYYFRRKIPNTSKSFTFSLKSKNAKIASKVISLFLSRAEPLFQSLKTEKRDDIMSNMETILNLLGDYRVLALEEYSKIEEARHKQFQCVSKKGKERDGGHPKCIKKWLKILQDCVYSPNSKYNLSEYFDDIFKRTGIDLGLLQALTNEERQRVEWETVKSEAFVLKEDLERAKEHFDTKRTSIFANQVLPTQISQSTGKHYEQTAQEMADKFLIKKETKDKIKELRKYTNPLDIFLSFTKNKYLIDFSPQDMIDFITIIKHLPSKNTKTGRELLEKHKGDYLKMVRDIQEKGIDTIALSTAMTYIENTSQFLDYAIKVETLDKNRLHDSPDIPTAKQISEASGKQTIKRLPFDNDDLNALFNKSDWYREDKIDMTLKNWPNRFYIPLVSLFGGMRLNEASQLYVNDILEEDGIYYFRVDDKNRLQRLKTGAARRDIPIHPKLIDLGLLNYVNKVKELGEERVFFQNYHTVDKGYGQSLGKEFGKKKFKDSWLDISRFDTDRYTKVFHSFRHTFSTRMFARAEAREVDFLMGHKNDIVPVGYIRPPIKSLLPAVEKLDIEGVDFSTLEQALEKINYFR